MTLRFGVVGTAHWASEVHVPGILAAPGAVLAGIWGRDAGKAAELAARHGTAAFASYAALLEAVDAVAFAVPPAVQAELAGQAARRGRHLLLEKPLAADLPAAARLAAAIEAAGVAGVVFFTRRFIPAWREAIAREAARGHRTAELVGHSDAMATDSPFAGSAWRQRPGAALWDIAPHLLSVLIPVLGPVRAVAAEPEREGVTRLATTHEGGGEATLSVALRAAPRSLTRFGDSVLPPMPFDRAATLAAAAGELAALAAGGARAHPCDARFGLEVVRILAAAERSQATGRPEPLDPTAPHP